MGQTKSKNNTKNNNTKENNTSKTNKSKNNNTGYKEAPLEKLYNCRKNHCKENRDEAIKIQKNMDVNALTMDEKLEMKENMFQMFEALDNNDIDKTKLFMEKLNRMSDKKNENMQRFYNTNAYIKDQSCILTHCKSILKQALIMDRDNLKIMLDSLKKDLNSDKIGNVISLFDEINNLVEMMAKNQDNLNIANLQKYYRKKDTFLKKHFQNRQYINLFVKNEKNKTLEEVTQNTIHRIKNESKDLKDVLPVFNAFYFRTMQFVREEILTFDEECRTKNFIHQIRQEESKEKPDKYHDYVIQLYKTRNAQITKKDAIIPEDVVNTISKLIQKVMEEKEDVYECVLSSTKALDELKMRIDLVKEVLLLMKTKLMDMNKDTIPYIDAMLSYLDKMTENYDMIKNDTTKNNNSKVRLQKDGLVGIFALTYLIEIQRGKLENSYKD